MHQAAGIEGRFVQLSRAPRHALHSTDNMAETDGHDVHFESADAGASLTYPQAAGTVRKNGFLVIKGRPCKVCLCALASTNLEQTCTLHSSLRVSQSSPGRPIRMANWERL